MKRGFPRPRTRVDKIQSFLMHADVKAQYEGKDYPHPYSAREEDIGMLHDGRVRHCITQCMCIVCGEHVKPEGPDGLVWVYRSGGMLMEDSGPFHEKCVVLTKTMCPVVKHRNYAWEQVPWSEVGPLIRGKHDFRRRT